MTRGTPSRGVRVPDELWEVVQLKAAQEGITASQVAQEAFREYAGKGVLVGNAPRTHYVRVPERIWAAAIEKSQREKTSVSSVVTDALRGYIATA